VPLEDITQAFDELLAPGMTTRKERGVPGILSLSLSRARTHSLTHSHIGVTAGKARGMSGILGLFYHFTRYLVLLY
jgi:hypothetical protein